MIQVLLDNPDGHKAAKDSSVKKRHSAEQIVAKLLGDTEKENARLSRLVADRALDIEVSRSFTAQDVIPTLQYLFAVRGAPKHIRSCNGP